VEGHAKIYTKYHEKNGQGQTVENEVFYNPVQVFNRDVSVLMMQGYINQLKEESNRYDS
jgi:tRNA G26 N,N-dimethylase Trm1